MREIKFRAWDRGCKMMIAPFDIRTLIKAFNDESNDAEYADHPVYQHLSFTGDAEGYDLMQLTGLKDKNGVDIYEGDVVQFADKWEWHRSTFGGGFLATKADYDEVLTDHVKYPYERRVVELPLDYKWLLSSEIQIYWEVIGNVFENPELLEAK